MSLNVRLPTLVPTGTAGSAAGERNCASAPRASSGAQRIRRGSMATSTAGRCGNCRPSYRRMRPGGMTGCGLVRCWGRRAEGETHGGWHRERRGGGVGPGEGVAGGRPVSAGVTDLAVAGARTAAAGRADAAPLEADGHGLVGRLGDGPAPTDG